MSLYPFAKISRSVHSYPMFGPSDVLQPMVKVSAFVQMCQKSHPSVWPFIGRIVVLAVAVDTNTVKLPSSGPLGPAIIHSEAEKNIQNGL